MILAISGTPCTGKTAVAEILAKKSDANLISISELLKDVRCSWDRKRKTKIVDVKDLQKAVNKHTVKGKANIIEGHLSHLLNADMVIVLRCSPEELEERMRKKKWNKGKILENIQAEILDEITIEAIEKHEKNKILEIDTSNKAPAAVVAIIKKLLNNPETKEYRAGKIDWSEKYRDYLLRR